MSREKLEQELRATFDDDVEKVRPSRNLVSDVMPRLERRERRGWWWGLVPRTRLAWTLVPLGLAAIGGAAYGVSTLMEDHIKVFAPDIVDAGLVTSLDLSQTINGITVKLEQGYADPSTVLIGYTVTGPRVRYYAGGEELSIVGGPVLDGTGGLGYVPVLGWNEPVTTQVLTFDSSVIGGDPSEVHLRFETWVGQGPGDRGKKAGVGPFVFNFTLPFRAGKSITVGQTVTAAGVEITLERVLITTARTEAAFRVGNYETIRDRPLMVTSLQPAPSSDNSTPGPVSESSCDLREVDSVTYYPGDFTSRPGEWTLTVKELVFVPRRPPGVTGDYAGKASDVKRIAGPWVFRFEVR